MEDVVGGVRSLGISMQFVSLLRTTVVIQRENPHPGLFVVFVTTDWCFVASAGEGGHTTAYVFDIIRWLSEKDMRPYQPPLQKANRNRLG